MDGGLIQAGGFLIVLALPAATGARPGGSRSPAGPAQHQRLGGGAGRGADRHGRRGRIAGEAAGWSVRPSAVGMPARLPSLPRPCASRSRCCGSKRPRRWPRGRHCAGGRDAELRGAGSTAALPVAGEGNVTVTAHDGLTLAGPNGGFFSDAAGSGRGGTLDLRARDIHLTERAALGDHFRQRHRRASRSRPAAASVSSSTVS